MILGLEVVRLEEKLHEWSSFHQKAVRGISWFSQRCVWLFFLRTEPKPDKGLSTETDLDQENSNMHIIDARTFHTHVIVPVPYVDPKMGIDPRAMHRERTGVEGGTWGIAGVGFDPTGNWLYSGTEATVIEWDLRRVGGGEGGTWGLA